MFLKQIYPVNLFVIIIAIAVVLAEPSAAEGDVVSIYKGIDEYEAVYKGYAFPPAEEFLNNSQYAEYWRALESGQCHGALMGVALAFHEQHPETPHPITTDRGMIAWAYFIEPKHYPAPLYCRAKKGLADARGKISGANIDAPRFPQRRSGGFAFSNLPFPVRMRDLEIADLIRLAIFDYGPAYLELAKLSEEGQVLRLTPSYTYFALARAKQAGVKDPQLEALYAKAVKSVDAAERARLSSRVKTGRWPRAEPLVMD